jgi:hypothetical protein
MLAPVSMMKVCASGVNATGLADQAVRYALISSHRSEATSVDISLPGEECMDEIHTVIHGCVVGWGLVSVQSYRGGVKDDGRSCIHWYSVKAAIMAWGIEEVWCSADIRVEMVIGRERASQKKIEVKEMHILVEFSLPLTIE